MEKQVFYIHGGESYSSSEAFLQHLKTADIRDLPGGESSQKWTSTFREDLGNEYEVFMPAMPNKQNASYAEWKTWFERHFVHLRDEVILMGCSLGAMFLSKYLAENKTPFSIKRLYLLAPAAKVPDFDYSDCEDFLIDLHVIEEIAKKVPNITLMCSKDDFVVPYEHVLAYKEALPTAELIVFEDKNHFLIAEFPELLEHLKGA